jgi:SHS2 domain-containing protein
MKKYRVFDHTADLGVEILGRTQAELFRRAALALFDLLVAAVDAPKAAATETRTLVIDGADSADLFVNFLREILYLFNGKGLVLTACRIVQIDAGRLTAQIRCRRYDVRTDRVKTEIKAVTYHQAAVTQTARGWQGRIVFDV